MTEGTQTINGLKTFSHSLGSTFNTTTINATLTSGGSGQLGTGLNISSSTSQAITTVYGGIINASTTASSFSAAIGLDITANATVTGDNWGLVVRKTSNGDHIRIKGTANNTASNYIELVPASLSASRTYTLPEVNTNASFVMTAGTYPGDGRLSLLNVSSTANSYTTILTTPTLAAGTYFVQFEGGFSKSNTTSSTLIFSARMANLNTSTLRGGGFYSVADNTTYTNFLLNHSSNVDNASGSGFVTSAIAATRSFSRIQFSGFFRVNSGTTNQILIRVAAGTAIANFSMLDGCALFITRVA
jgi:hypothetical protein